MKGALKGLIRLQENENGQLMFSGEISGLKPPGNHGFHVHQVFHDGGDDDDDDGDGDDLYIIGAVCPSVSKTKANVAWRAIFFNVSC